MTGGEPVDMIRKNVRERRLAMTPSHFRNWRKSLGLKQKEAAELLGLNKRMIQSYETYSSGEESGDGGIQALANGAA